MAWCLFQHGDNYAFTFMILKPVWVQGKRETVVRPAAHREFPVINFPCLMIQCKRKDIPVSKHHALKPCKESEGKSNILGAAWTSVVIFTLRPL
jgi:hypothetical protein